MKTRNQLISTARKQRQEISQYLRDVTHWNNTRGKTEGMIDPDPDGSMERMAHALDRMLEAEDARPNAPAQRPPATDV